MSHFGEFANPQSSAPSPTVQGTHQPNFGNFANLPNIAIWQLWQSAKTIEIATRQAIWKQLQ